MSWFMRLMGASNLGEVDAAGQQRVILYDAAGNPITSVNRAALAETAGGALQSVKEYKLQRTLRGSSIGSVHVAGDDTILLQDSFRGTLRNITHWIEQNSTMVSAQAVATGLTLNSGASVAINVGIIESTHRQLPFIGRGALLMRIRLRTDSKNNSVAEWGISDIFSATTPGHQNGAFFRKDAAGSLQPVLAYNGTETQGTVMAAPATTEYATYELLVEDTRALFQIVSATGALLSSQVMEIGSAGGGAGVTTQPRMFALTHIGGFFRLYNTGTAPASAPTLVVNQVTIQMCDVYAQRPHEIQQSGMGLNALVDPTTNLQLAQYGNSAAPAAAVLSNAAASYTTLGGLFLGPTPTPAGALTDFALFGWQNVTGYTFYFTGAQISVQNRGAAVATTATVLEWALAFNALTVGLGGGSPPPYSPMKIPIGRQTFAIGAAIDAVPVLEVVSYFPRTPLAVFPGRFFHIVLRIPVGTATAAGFLQGGCCVDGYFE